MSDDAPPATPATPKGAVTAAEPTRLQAQIARRTAEARAIVPDVTVRLQVVLPEGTSPDGFTARVVAACGTALRELPAVNGAYRDARLERHERVNVGVVVVTDEAFLTPTLFDADSRDAANLAADLARLAARARAGELEAPEQSGATFTVWDVGAEGVDALTPVITPPQAAALGVGRVRDRVVAVDGAPAVRPAVDLVLCCDHRAVYPAQAARFLARVGALLAAA